MSLRSEWVAAKTKAKTHNNKKDVKFTTKLDLGPLLDTYEAAKKAHDAQERNNKPENKAWGKIAQAYADATKAAHTAAVAYLKDVDGLDITADARSDIKTGIMKMAVLLNKSVDETNKLGKRIAAARIEGD